MRLLRRSGRPAAEVARELGVRRNQLYKWDEQCKTNGTDEVFPGPGRRVGAVLREGIRVRYQFIADHDREYRIRAMCRVLPVSPSGFYGWKRRPESGRAQANRDLLHRIRAIHGGAREA